ncbi:MAG: hypothetical protein WBD99_01320 [Thermodesulfobacteriota bacterium]
MRISYFLFGLAVLLAVWSMTAEKQSQGQQQGVIQSTRTYKIPLSPKEQRIVNNLKPGQVAVKTVIFASDQDTANSTGDCCPKGKCCCTCQCDPKPCICTCTDEIVVK